MNAATAAPRAVDTAVPARVVAEHFRWLRTEEGEPTTSLHLVKLVYIAHGWTLGLYGTPLIQEAVEAWKYGPVIPAIYHRYRPFGGFHINLPAKSREEDMSDDQREMVDVVERGYRRFTAVQLSAMAHEEGSPWDITVRKHGLGNAVIPTPLIQEHYASKLVAE
ncbi:MAG: DUF4065 domain-containing protein [Rhodobacteraceae bacterium]|nr:DUF4065 domain-containing protein [Paracoccaceae bacterium]